MERKILWKKVAMTEDLSACKYLLKEKKTWDAGKIIVFSPGKTTEF